MTKEPTVEQQSLEEQARAWAEKLAMEMFNYGEAEYLVDIPKAVDVFAAEILPILRAKEEAEQQRDWELLGEMASAIKGQAAAADELMTEFISKKRAANWGVINSGLVAGGSALSKYEAALAERGKR